MRGRLLVGLLGAGVAGGVAVGLGLACSAPYLPGLPQDPPPSDAAVAWVGCYTCNTSITGIPTLDAGPRTATIANGLSVYATGDTLIGRIADLDSGDYVCLLEARLTGAASARLYDAYDAEPGCEIDLAGQPPVFFTYTDGTFALEGGVITGQLAVSFPPPVWCYVALDGGDTCDEAGFADGGVGAQVSSCTYFGSDLGDATCPWQ